MDPLEHYTYEPLPQGRFIRLICLHPSQRLQSELSINIATHHLAEAPQYAALSYTWGNSPNTIPIKCDERVIGVRRSLQDALRRIRHPEHTIRLWVDALCINQDSKAEKEHQIPFMTDIYRNAEDVLIWLGEGTEESRLAIQILSLLPYVNPTSRHESTEFSSGSNSEKQKGFQSVYDIAPHGHRAWETLENLLKRPWLTRVWILQEVAFATRATMICGPDNVSWTAIGRIHPETSDEIWNTVTPSWGNLTTIHNACCSTGSLASLLIATLEFESSEPRDRIYALLGLISPSERMLDDFTVRIDYSIPVADLYANVTRWCMSREPKLLALFLELASATGSVENLPSWAIDWSVTLKNHFPTLWSKPSYWGEDFVICSTSGYDINKLPLSGVHFDTVERLGKRTPLMITCPTHTGFLLLDILQDWQNLVDEVVVGREDLAQTFFDTLFTYNPGGPEGQKLREVGLPRLCDMLGLYKLGANCSAPKTPPEAWNFLNNILPLFENRRMCLTSSGRLCMCPARTEKGDILVGLETVETVSGERSRWRNNASCLLRKHASHYFLVGRCFIHRGVHGNNPTEVFLLV